MPKFKVTLARQVSEIAFIIVEAPTQEILDDQIHKVYDRYEGDKWQPDTDWGCEEGTHYIAEQLAGENDRVDMTLEG